MKLLDIYEKSVMFRRTEGGEISDAAVSMYTIGIVLKEFFSPELSFCETEEYSFEDIWYLLCRYHDVKKECDYLREHLHLADREGNVSFSPLYQYIGGGIQYTNGICIRNSMYTELEVMDYFYFRNVCSIDNEEDHGIVGGLLLYEYLVRRKLKRGGELDKRALNLYSYAANTMMVHNMYKNRADGRKISFGEDPLLFLFLFAETIEPLQYARQETDLRKVLRMIRVHVLQRKLIVSMDPEYCDMFELEKKMELLKKRMQICCDIMRETSELCICV